MKTSVPALDEGVILPADFNTAKRGAERRTEGRIDCTKQIVILPFRPSITWAFKRVEMFDCSEHGLGLYTDEPIGAGDLFLAKLRLQKITLVAYQVRHCIPLERGFKIGAWMTGLVGRPDLCDPAAVLKALLEGAG
jgi:hypothetical protein